MPELCRPPSSPAERIDASAAAIEPQVIAWRRDSHANPDLGNREHRTAGIVAAHLCRLGFDIIPDAVEMRGTIRSFDEAGLLLGVRALAHPACDFLESAG